MYVEIDIAPTNGPLEMTCSERAGFVLLASQHQMLWVLIWRVVLVARGWA